MAKLEKAVHRTAKPLQFDAVNGVKRQVSSGQQRVVKPVPVAGSFSRAEAKHAVIAVMQQYSSEGE